MSFDTPLLIYAVPAAALVVLLLAWLARWRRIRAAGLWSAGLAKQARHGALIPLALALVGGLAMAGVAGPRWGAAQIDTETRALNLVCAIDISRSMLAEDASPSRLMHAVQEARRLLQDTRGDRVALLAFAGRSYILTPLTLDDGAVMLQLDALDPDVASEGGTEMATVLKQGRELLGAASEGGARVLVLFTDGEAHDSLPAALAEARQLRADGVTVIVVGQGGTGPAKIPIRDEAGALVEYKKDGAGKEVLTQRRDDVLRAVADAAEGILVPGSVPDQAGAVWRTLATLDRDPARGRRTEDLIPRAWIFAAAAFVVLLVATLTRPAASLVALGGLTLLSASAAAQRPTPAARRLDAADTTRAMEGFLRAARTGRGDTSWYNAGSLAMLRAQYDVAEEALGAASNSLDPSVRFQALYNLGLTALRQSRADTARRKELAATAAQRFREALLLSPTSFATKWNLELASQLSPPPPPSNAKQPQPKGGPPPPSPPVNKGMSSTEAEQILRSVERAEQGVRADQLRRRRVARSANGKDW